MLSNFDLNHLLTFPVKDDQARKHFLVGTLVYLAAFIIPIIPLLFATGYLMRIMRQILKGEQPHMIMWDEWEEMFKDGARLFGVRLIYMLPIFLLLCPLLGFNIALPIIIENAGPDAEWIFLIFPIFFAIFFLIFIPFTVALSVFLPVAEVHVTEKDEFAAAFRVREWWEIFRANWGGFLLALAISYGISLVLTFVMQFMMLTIILICILPFIMPAIAMYMSLIMYSTFAQAYKEGIEKIRIEPESTTK